MEDAVSRFIAELESHHLLQDQPDSECPISESSLLSLQSVFHGEADTIDTELFWEEMAAKNLPHSSLTRYISASMECSSPSISLLASELYLSILLSPSSPLYTLFSPISFLSLLRSLRQSFKQRISTGAPCVPSNSKSHRKKRASSRKNARRSCESETEADTGYGDAPQINFKVILSILGKLASLLDRIQFSRFSDSLKSLAQTVAELPVVSLDSLQSSADFSSLCDACFHILNRVLLPEHGDQTVVAVEVLKSLSPSILLLKSQVRTYALHFVTQEMMAKAKRSSEIRQAIVYFPRFLASKAPEKSDPRLAAVDSVLEIVRAMEPEDQIGFSDYVVKMTKGKMQLRLVAVDLIIALITSLPHPLALNQGIGEECGSSWGSRVLMALIERCSDVAAGVRARALSNLAQAVGFLSEDAVNRDRLRDLLGFGCSGDGEGLNVLIRRCTDEKAAVKKAALCLIMKSTDLLGQNIDENMLKMIASACSDPLVSIRKAAIAALSEVFMKLPGNKVTEEWLYAVPRLIMDNETSIQVECENLFQDLVLDHISRIRTTDSRCNTTNHSQKNMKGNFQEELESLIPVRLLDLLKEICNAEVAPYVKKIIASLGKKKQLKRNIAISLQNIIKTSESVWLNHSMPLKKWTAPAGAWFLLSEVSSYLPKAIEWEFIHHHWKLLDDPKSLKEVRSPSIDTDMIGNVGVQSNSVSWAEDRVFLLHTIANVSVELPPEPAADLAHNLYTRIESFSMHSIEVNAHIKALKAICMRKASNAEEGDSLVSKWVNQLLSKASSVIDAYLTEISESRRKETFLTPPQSNSRKGKGEAVVSKSLLKTVTAVFTIGCLVLVCPSGDLKSIIPLLHTIITSGSSKSKPKELADISVSLKQVTPSLYIQSWLAMGKICLVDGKLAKRYIPLFVQELEKSDCAALRNNIVMVMADFCVRYTALIDCYIPRLSKFLGDSCEVVRRQTFILLSRLLQRDYVKWRGVLFLRFLPSLVDESEKIRQLAYFLFASILKAKAPLLAYNSFVEAIFFLNDCHAHAGHSQSQTRPSQCELFSFRGNDEQSRSKRMQIYSSLLKQMAPEHLLATSAKLCAEILAAASDGLLDLNDISGQSVLQDALQILACKEMRIQQNRGAVLATDVSEMEEEGGESGGAASDARGRVVTQVAKKNLVQNAIPIFIELKRLLESKNSPLTGCLMECLRILLKDYKNEIDDILVADKQLQKELMYDIHKHEAAIAKMNAAEAVSNIQRSGSHHSPYGHSVGSGPSRQPKKRNVHGSMATKLRRDEKTAAVVAGVAAAATARSVLKELNVNSSTPPLNSMSIPKIKSSAGSDRPVEVLESLRRRQAFDSDDEN